jgi:hypothetical protein
MQDAARRRRRRLGDTPRIAASPSQARELHEDPIVTTEREIDMKRSATAIFLCTLVALAGCANMTEREQRTLSGAAIGTGVGAAAGAIGGNLGLGAAIGAAAGAAGGLLVDEQKKNK